MGKLFKRNYIGTSTVHSTVIYSFLFINVELGLTKFFLGKPSFIFSRVKNWESSFVILNVTFESVSTCSVLLFTVFFNVVAS